MTRPKTRTSTLEAGVVQEIKTLFGTRPNAYSQLMPGGKPLTYTVFVRAASGQLVAPADLQTLKSTLLFWKRQHLK